MSSARMKTMLGLAVTLWVCVSLMFPFHSEIVPMYLTEAHRSRE
jgi:ABC-type glycerol-3-phosphate transport system permease component